MWLAYQGWTGTGSAQSFFCMLMGGCNFGNDPSSGGGGGAKPAEPLPPPPVLHRRPNTVCTKALAVANMNQDAVLRANKNWATLDSAGKLYNINPDLLAAIGVRESGFRNVNEQDGSGVGGGVFQITVSRSSGVTAQQAGNLTWAANYAANMLSSNLTTLSSKFPNFDPAHLLQATAASYNFGTGNISGNPDTIDVGTTGGNYGSNVVQLMDCF